MKLLHIDSSILGEGSVSRLLTEPSPRMLESICRSFMDAAPPQG